MAVKSQAIGSIYLIAVMTLPTEAERLEGAKKVLVVEPTFIVAADAEAASTAAVLRIPRDTDPDRCEVMVALPFGR